MNKVEIGCLKTLWLLSALFILVIYFGFDLGRTLLEMLLVSVVLHFTGNT